MPTNSDATDDDLSGPITRRELEEVLDQRLENFATKDDLKNELKNELENYPTKDDLKNELKNELENYPTKDDLKNELKNYATKDDLKQLREDIAKDTQAAVRAISEENRAWFRTIDDKYKDLPERVHKLEEAVFPPPPRSRRKKAG